MVFTAIKYSVCGFWVVISCSVLKHRFGWEDIFKIYLKEIKKWDGILWTRFIWLRIRTSGGLL
jgi:hypothetical protein